MPMSNSNFVFIVSGLLNSLQLTVDSPFETHPITIRIAIASLLMYGFFKHDAHQRFSHHSPTYATVVRGSARLFSTLTLASLSSILFPDSIRPLLYLLHFLFLAGELTHWFRRRLSGVETRNIPSRLFVAPRTLMGHVYMEEGDESGCLVNPPRLMGLSTYMLMDHAPSRHLVDPQRLMGHPTYMLMNHAAYTEGGDEWGNIPSRCLVEPRSAYMLMGHAAYMERGDESGNIPSRRLIDPQRLMGHSSNMLMGHTAYMEGGDESENIPSRRLVDPQRLMGHASYMEGGDESGNILSKCLAPLWRLMGHAAHMEGRDRLPV